MLVGVPAEIVPGERRVALTPDAVKALCALGIEVAVQSGAGEEAGSDDAAYKAAGARIESDPAAVFGADLVLKVQPPSERAGGGHEVDALRADGVLVGFLRPLDEPQLAARLAKRGVTSFAMELIPRITRAQSMDALSSMSTIAGYRAVILAAGALPKIFPMMVTAAGTIQPARVFVIGAGVAGLQAIATARRLGAVVEAYDTRPAVREQVESLGGRFVELDLEVGDAEDQGGYAKAQSEAFYDRQREQLGKRLAGSDVVITTALVPGQRAPVLIDEAAVVRMRAGSVIVDLAAELGGNCELTNPEQEIVAHGVRIVPGRNLPSDIPSNSSQMYAKNLVTFIKHLAPKGELELDLEDEITSGSLLTHEGAIVNDRVKGLVEGANR
ncbi:MAG: Re/Si-specific NAD(P)(+) transhydrogenase subunit alpha [Myxococcales bacterium]|nr:Re/Si-specific NAD(P)(+) transhydrogenase subunit alpha [Myxococcales bacterium]MDH5307173.1 Re/Si-specific NAD(P)(+) transhydrogenase subunit alpha [Myxococcales bacterium]